MHSSRSTASDEQHRSKSVVVVGGGLAGIAAALALARQGVQVRIIESRRRLGGRTGSFTDGQGDPSETIDYCQHVSMGCCTNLKQLSHWLGQEDAWTEYAELHSYSARDGYRRLAALPFLPAPFHLTGWLFSWPGLNLRDRVQIARGLLAIGRITIDGSHDAQSALDWLYAHKQTANGLKNFWNTIVISALGEELSRVNLASVCKVLQDGFLSHRRAFHLLVPNQPLDKLFNVEATCRLKELGVAVEFGMPVEAIARTNGRVMVTSRGRDFPADAAVVAVPWHRLSSIDADSSIAALAEVSTKAENLMASPISGIHTWWDRSWLEQPHAMIVGQLCQWVFAGSAVNAAEDKRLQREHYYQIVVSAARGLPSGDSEAVRQLVLDDLGAVFPRSLGAKLLRIMIVKDPQAVFSVAPNSQSNRADCRALGSDVVLAGDWTLTGWPATMEGAVLSGFKAAEALLSSWQCKRRISAAPLGGNN